jgi:predicted DNA binding CopG/RHH family protein
MANREIEFALSEDDLERVKREAVRRGTSLEDVIRMLADRELRRRSQPLTHTGSVVPFRRRAD